MVHRVTHTLIIYFMELNIAFLQVFIHIDLYDSSHNVHSMVVPNYLNIVPPDCYTPN